MAELDIGKQCSVESCQQLDFLPFSCSGCAKIFCKVHRSCGAHNCPQDQVSHDRPEYTRPRSLPCSIGDCNNKELTPVICESCQKHFCLKHRHQSDHSCEKLETPKERMTETAAHVQNILDAKQKKPQKSGSRGRKSKATAAKVALMKIKMKASADKGTPETERVFLQILLPQISKHRSKPMFFSKKWSLGRIIDQIASAEGLQNNNNVAIEKKLCLFDPEDGHLYPTEDTLESLMGGGTGIFNGGTVILEYVDNDVSILENFEKYQS